ncbi:hypothetical protein [Mycobacterium kyogaense]|uniref:hypothetical protein n=1 Tax=Mycobacterium kyogaense TaxID=2212479 RepID=UPI000DAE0914|nr:hypothetical protein [Mycobacterium kyogaense]
MADDVLRDMVKHYLTEMPAADRDALVAEIANPAGGEPGGGAGGPAGGDQQRPEPKQTLAEQIKQASSVSDGADLYARMHTQSEAREYGRNK